ncbi:TetR/AcrR family transcriptional regulator [Fusobacterium sp. PH5-44]|uniref:TetR/AcrR family transcriptional regulator n=1 Tax=unclassified Fusobacterium TaxID=2648384 RepID=UPI003D201614
MQDKRESIISALKKVILKKGYSKTSIEDITTEAGISKGSFYTYFKNKDEVLNDIIKRKNDIIKAKTEAILKEKITLEETIEKIIEISIKLGDDEDLEREMAVVNVMQNLDILGKETKCELVRVHESSIKYVQDILVKYGEEIDLKVKDISKSAKMISCMIKQWKIDDFFIETDEEGSIKFVNDIKVLKDKKSSKKVEEDLKFLKEIILKILK